MLLILFLALLCVPLLELFVIIQVSGLLGFWNTVILMLLISGAGAWMVRCSGFGVVQRIKSRLAQRQLPTVELLDGVLILIAGAFMLTPGFFTDSLGLMLLMKPTRLLVRTILVRYFTRKVRIVDWLGGSGRRFGGFSGFRVQEGFNVRTGGNHSGHSSNRDGETLEATNRDGETLEATNRDGETL